MSGPTGLRAPADDVGEDVGRRPGVGLAEEGVYLFVGGVVDTEVLFDELGADVGLFLVVCWIASG